MKETKFKQTEVGMIPRDWEVIKLCDLCYLITKQTGFDYSAAIKPSLVRNSSSYTLPFIQNKDFEGTKINFETDFYIPKSVAINYPKILLNEPVLLISISGRIGNVAYFSHQKDAFIGGAVGVARFNDKRLIEWTNLYLQSVDGQTQIFANEKSGAQHNLTIADVRNLKIAFPKKIEEQQRVANALSDVDSLIANLEKLIAKKKNIKQGAMQQLLTGKKRLPGFAPAKPSYKQTELGKIPADWEVFELSQLYDITSSKRVFQKDWTSAGVPFYRAREIAVMSTGRSPEEDLFITREMFDAYTTQYGKIKENDVLITGVGTLGKMYVVKAKDEFYFKDGNIIWLQWKRRNSSQLLKLFYETNIVIDQIFGNSGGSTVATYTISNAKKTKIPLPSTIDEQTAIANVLSDMDAEISALETKLAKYRKLKTGMMQQLLTGKIRLV